MKILLVDDEIECLELLQDILEKEGFQVIACTNGNDAIKVLKEETIQLLITDLQMSIVTGQHLIQITNENFPRLPILVVTGNKDLLDKDIKVHAILEKPCKIKYFIRTVKKILKKPINEIRLNPKTTKLKKFRCMSDRAFIKAVLDQTDWNRKETAELLDISRQTLNTLMKQLNLNRT